MIVCRNPDLARQRGHKPQTLLDATMGELNKVRKIVEGGRLKGKDRIGVRVGKVVNKYKMAKHIRLEIGDDSISFQLREEKIRQEAAWNASYVIRTSVSRDRMNSEDTVHSLKRSGQVEQAFRSFKSIDLAVRPIHHRLAKRVRAHIFLCMLAYYVKWHMMEALRPLLFADEDLQKKQTRMRFSCRRAIQKGSV